jgi:hypothetical protein
MMLQVRYEARPKPDGDYEVWQFIVGKEADASHVATFHNFLRGIDPNNIAEINAAQFVNEQNEREMSADAGFAFIRQLQP